MPLYQQEEQNIALPTKERIDALIANASTVMSTKLTLSKETGLRPVELCRLKVKDIDTDTNKVYPITAKHGQARTLNIPINLSQRLKEYINKNKLQKEDKLWQEDADHYGANFREMRNKLAKKLNDPKIAEIRLYDLRHYFCTMTLHNTNDTYYTMVQMGHKHLTTTQKYLHLIESSGNEEYTSKAIQTGTPTTLKEIMELINEGFTKADEIEGIHIYKKRK
jgi:integrase